MIGHLGGARISALLDGRLPVEEEERAWEHVHTCHPCRDLVEREGWVKTRLACLNYDSASAPSSLKHALLMGAPTGASAMHGHVDAPLARHRPRHLVALGGGAVGAAVLGVLAFGALPAGNPPADRRGPVTSLVTPAPTSTPASTPASSPASTPSGTGSGAAGQGAAEGVARVVGGSPVRLGVVREKMVP